MKVGIITNAYERPRIQSLVKYLERKAEVSIYLEDHYLVNFNREKFEEDVFFTKGKGYILLTLAKIAEEWGKDFGVPVINPPHAVWLATHRFMNAVVCEEAGVQVPEYALARSRDIQWTRFIAKNIIDQNHLRNLDVLPVVGSPGSSVENQRTGEEAGTASQVPEYHFFQKYVDSQYEYKVYGFGKSLYFYRQIPVLVNPDKMASRVPIEEIPELRIMALKAMEATGLEVTSIDFLESDGQFYMTDINPIPNFNYLENGPQILGDYLLARAS